MVEDKEGLTQVLKVFLVMNMMEEKVEGELALERERES